MYKLVMLALIFLSACGEGTEKDKSNKAISPPTHQSHTDRPADGSDLFSRYGCFTCHSLDGRVMYGPPLNDLFMKEVTVERQGKEQTIVADRKYFSKAIMDPDFEKVSEYEKKVMPKPEIPEDELETLIDYLIGLGEEE